MESKYHPDYLHTQLLFHKRVKQSSKENCKKVFKYLFFLFRICAIFRTDNFSCTTSVNCIKRISLVTLNCFLVLLLTASIIANNTQKNYSASASGNLAIAIISLTHRWIICSRIGTLQKLSFRIIKLSRDWNLDSTSGKRMSIYMWSCFAILMHISYNGFSIITLYYDPHLSTTNNFIFSPALKVTIVVIFPTFIIGFLMFPVSLFALYYAAICRHLRDVLKNFTKTLEAEAYTDYVGALKQNLLIRKLILEADSELSILVFTSTLYHAGSAYFGITSLLHIDEFKTFAGWMALSAIWSSALGNFVPFLAMVVAGSSVHEASASVWDKAQEMINAGQELTPSQKRFLSVAEKELAMTVWQITPVKRSYILATMGTILTYCILLDSIVTNRK
ncbi:uncharacterized protein CDAR_454061 [Caerostris darwini]|uniref:Gustatory receptor n=1 Tax=Caerostris darwini TaxID=1538125 RepID=A0AAV4V8K1_9ARAC|nr:uncharacterized protein CDAR_454061 [Caerostris darwini]